MRGRRMMNSPGEIGKKLLANRFHHLLLFYCDVSPKINHANAYTGLLLRSAAQKVEDFKWFCGQRSGNLTIES
jgi:hypothetical protein